MVDTWIVGFVGGLLGCGNVTGPQAVNKISPTQRTNKLLSTLAVYHKIYLDLKNINQA
jgi:hypothetical protein